MKPCSNTDAMIGDYIEGHFTNNFSDSLAETEGLETVSYLSELPNGLLGWYPFEAGGRILQIGSWFGVYGEMLAGRCRELTILEADPYRAYMTDKRLKAFPNIRVFPTDAVAYCKNCSEKFHYVIFIVDETIERIPDADSYRKVLNAAKQVLSPEGKLLFALPNRLGVKYLCGVPDPKTHISFDGITENNSELYRFDREELLQFIKGLGFFYVKMYYPMPDFSHPQVIYTDEFRPDSSIQERLHIYTNHKTKRFLDEWILLEKFARNDVMHCFTNLFLVEAGNTPCSQVIYSALSAERDRSRAFATNIYNNGIVEKVPFYPEGKGGIRKLLEHTRELSARGIPVLKMQEKEGKAVMKRVFSPSLSAYLKDTVKKDANAFIECIDKLRGYIWDSSEHLPEAENVMRDLAPGEDWGVILKKAYLEMIPVNSFCDNGHILFYDQEFTKENCPANYVLFRALRDIYGFSPEIDKIVSLDFMKERYGLVSTWEFYAQEEENFQRELRQRNRYTGFFQWIRHLFGTVQENRNQISLPENFRKSDCFNVISTLDARRIILFGSGKLAECYLDKYGKNYPPNFLADNNPNQWGKEKNGIAIKNPEVITRLMPGTYRVIIAIKNYEPIAEQLEQMGIMEDSYRIFIPEIDALLDAKIHDAYADGKYHIGYRTGMFDSFYMEDIRQLRTCKSRSHYLIVGVLTDELILQTEGKKPEHSLNERMEMVRQCRYVDRVIPVDSGNYDPINAWKEFRYGCLFECRENKSSSSLTWLTRKLNTLGSTVEFL
ncbi:MAG: hypothetical protein HFG49_03195 [Lachnospiraceae bacterium]|nr:hypothetical protein [Lachnospiraceae bacterium]